MVKRAALARSISLDPDILFLDEPTAGLDPIGAAAFDQLILTLRDSLGLDPADMVLQQVGASLVEHVRAGDFVFRIGEDQFLVLLVDAPPAAVLPLRQPRGMPCWSWAKMALVDSSAAAIRPS